METRNPTHALSTAIPTASRAIATDASGYVKSVATTDTELGYLAGVTSAIQTQLDAKQASDGTLTALAALTIAANSLTIGTGADAFAQTTFAANTFPARASSGDLVAKAITDFGLSLVDDADAAAGRATLGFLTATAALDFGNILAASSADLTITVTGAAVGDAVILGPPAAPDASLTFLGFVSAADTVTVRAFNIGAVAVDQASMTFRATVLQ